MSQHEEPVDVTEPAAPIAEPVEAENADVDVEVDADVDAEVDVVDVPGREASLLAHKHQTRETLREFGIDIQDTPADGIADYRQWLAYIARRRGLVYRRGGRGLQPIGISQVFGDKPTAFVLVVEDGDVEENAYWWVEMGTLLTIGWKRRTRTRSRHRCGQRSRTRRSTFTAQ
jgi:hypothetical protein